MSGLIDQEIEFIYADFAKLYGVEADGDIVELLNFDAEEFSNLSELAIPGYNFRIGFSSDGSAVVNGQLTATVSVAYSPLGDFRISFINNYVGVITEAGNFETISTVIEGILPSGSSRQEPAVAVDHNGEFYFKGWVGDRFGGVDEVFKLTTAGNVEQVSNMEREGGENSYGIASLGDEVYFIADQRHPLGNTELWRLNEDGTNEYIYVDLEGDVVDLDVFGGQVWFTVAYAYNSSKADQIFRIAEGATEPVHVMDFDTDFTLTVKGGRLFGVDRHPGGLTEFFADGTSTKLVPSDPYPDDLYGLFTDIYSIEVVGDLIYVSAQVNGSVGYTGAHLHTIDSDGTVTRVPNVSDGAETNSPRDLTVANGVLYFVSDNFVDDGFGGQRTVTSLHALYPDGSVKILNGELSENDVEYEYSTDFIAFKTKAFEAPTEGNDDRLGTGMDDTIALLGGNDTYHGRNGDDEIDGGAGNDTVYGGEGDDTALFQGNQSGYSLEYDRVSDVVTITDTDTTNGDSGTDTLQGVENFRFADQTTSLTDLTANVAPTGDVLVSGIASEGSTLTADTGTLADADGLGTLSYQWLRDGIAITGATSMTYDLERADVGGKISVQVSYTDDYGTDESVTSTATPKIPDPFIGDGTNNTITGDGRSNIIKGRGGDDLLSGKGRGDTISGEKGNDTLRGEAGNDNLFGGKGHDLLQGGGGADKANGGAGNDTLEGGGGNDQLFGEGARDVLDGGKGRDILTGGVGADKFVFMAGYGKDTVSDFQDDKDTIKLDTDLWSGTLNKQQMINKFASVIDGNIVFDFGKHELTLTGFSDLTELKDDISFI